MMAREEQGTEQGQKNPFQPQGEPIGQCQVEKDWFPTVCCITNLTRRNTQFRVAFDGHALACPSVDEDPCGQTMEEIDKLK